MYDILTTAAIAGEMMDSMIGGRIQRIGLRDNKTIAIELYRDHRRHHLVATIGDPEPAFYRSPDPFAIDPELVTPFALLLRKYVRGATLVAIEQPPLERIIRLSIAKRFWTYHREDDALDEQEEEEETIPSTVNFVYLVVELMGRHSNIILVDDNGTVMDSLKRVTPKMSRVRPIWPSARYELPPRRHGYDPRTITSAEIARLMQSSAPGTELAKNLISGVRGLSPAMATEIVYRADRNGEFDAERLAQATRAITAPLETGRWMPVFYRNEDGEPIGYAAIPFESLAADGNPESFESISEVVAAWQRTDLLLAGRHDGRRNRLLAKIREKIHTVDIRIRAIEKQEESVQAAERFRYWGEQIYAHLWEIEKGQTELVVDNESIPLDPLRPAKEVAAEYFDTYRRMQRGEDEIIGQLEKAQIERGYLDQLETMTALATSFAEIENVQAEWEAYAGPEKAAATRKRKQNSDRIRPYTDTEGNSIYIGRTGPQNDRVTFDIAGPDDWWLHARGVPGSHVIVRGNGREPGERALERAAAVAAWYSKNRTSGKVEVDLARRRDVRKIRGAGPGMVTYRNEHTVLVSPADESGA